jgi:hypothetical protein
MARAKVCPPGIFCITPGTGFLGVLVLLLVFGFVVYLLQTKPIQAPLPPEKKEPPVQIANVVQGGGGDDRYTRAPQPQRFWNNGPEIPVRGALLPPDGGMLINVPTQGLPEAYQSMGLLKTEDGKMLPLFGRRVASRSDRFNYYTRTDTYNPVPLPIHFQKKDCQDPVGCQEIFDGDAVKITPSGETAKATLYRFDGPLYVPSII